jgi:polyhydroxyalkanoate synthesis regulator phasin
MAENGNAPATKKDVAAVAKDVAAVAKDVAAVAKDVAAVAKDVAAVAKDVAALDTRLDVRMDGLSEQMRDMQTELLKAFLPWQEQVRIQFRELEVNTGNSVSTVKERMNILERRLWEIEKRLLMNPPAA